MSQPRLVFAIGATLFFLASPPIDAAPITFRFDAQITSTPAGAPFDLPLTYAVGDVISGRFTFDPGLGAPIADGVVGSVQPYEFVFNINGAHVASSPYSMDVHDDGAFDDSDWGTVDFLILRSQFEPDTQPPLISLPGGEPFRVRVLLTLVGGPTVLAAPAIPNELTLWNSLLLYRSLNLNFDNAGSGAMGLDATIDSFTLVPEPASIMLGGCAVAWGLAAKCAEYSASAG